jgi:uncharacterized membrane protein
MAVLALAAAGPLLHWPSGAQVEAEIFWRWLHIVSAILWVGFLYFFNLVSGAFLRELAPETRSRILPPFMWRALNWFRWASAVTVLSGLAFLGQLVTADARNGHARQGSYWGSFFGIWLAVWIIFYLLLRFTGSAPLIYTGTFIAIVLGAWAFLAANAHGWESNRILSIGIGGGMGFFLLLNVWGIVWRANKKLLRWTEAFNAQGTAAPSEAAGLMRQAAITSGLSFYVTFAIVFFMAAASHFPLFGV